MTEKMVGTGGPGQFKIVSLREEWFTDEDGNTHSRTVDPEDLAVFCDFDNEPWRCSASACLDGETR